MIKPHRFRVFAAFFLGVLGMANTRADTVSVASNPLWTDTGILLSGETISITATGTWNWGNGPVGPDGSFVGSVFDEWVQDMQHGQLVAFVGANPFGPYSPANYFAIGSSGSLSGLTGELWLGFNDDRQSGGVGDNSGRVLATIGSVPDASSMVSLLGLGFLGLATFRRKFCR